MARAGDDQGRIRRSSGGDHERLSGRAALRLLFDTHALLWWLDDESLGARAAAAVQDPANDVLVSSASAWEIAIKRALGKLEAPANLEAAIEAADLEPLAISVEHAIVAGALAPHHSDPFDRMLVAQARIERLTLLTSDPAIARYDVDVLPAR